MSAASGSAAAAAKTPLSPSHTVGATVAVVVTSDAWYHQTKPQRNVASSRAFNIHFIQVSFLGYQPLYFPQVTLCDQNGYTLFSLNPVNFVGAWKQQEISPPVGRLNQRNLPFWKWNWFYCIQGSHGWGCCPDVASPLGQLRNKGILKHGNSVYFVPSNTCICRYEFWILQCDQLFAKTPPHAIILLFLTEKTECPFS